MSMKDALLDAGLHSTKVENMRMSAKGREVKQSEKHQYTRNFCEICEQTMPDVERFKHKNPTTNAEWICLACADKYEILDDYRVSHQSDLAKKGMYARSWGPTKDPSEFDNLTHKKFEKKGERDSKKGERNRSNNNRRNNKNFKNRKNNKFAAKDGRNNRRNNNTNNFNNKKKKQQPRRGPNGEYISPSGARYTIDENGEKNFNC